MQDEINEKVVALSVKGAKLTAETLQKAIKAMLAQAKKQQEKQPHGKQTLKQLAKQNAGLSNIEITEGNIKAFEQTAKKYGIDFALKKDSTETPPRYLVFFKGRDADALNDIPVDCHFPQVGFHVPGRDELHFLFNERPFFLCYSEFNLYCPFPAVHRLTLLSIPRVWDTSQQAIFNRRAAAQEGENTERVPLSYAC